AQVEELERVLRPQVGRRLDEAALVGEVRDARARSHRKVVAALGTDPEVGLQLVVAVVRVAARAGVRMTALRRLGRVLVLDGDVDPGAHRRHDLRPRPPAAGYKPSAVQSRSNGARLAGSGVSPLKPAPTTAPRRRTSPKSAAASSTPSPAGSGMNDATSPGSKTSQSSAT